MAEAAPVILAGKPELVVAEGAAFEGGGLEIMQDLRQRLPALRWLLLPSKLTGRVVQRAQELGAHGIIGKQQARMPVLRRAVSNILQGGTYFCAQATELMQHSSVCPGGVGLDRVIAKLTLREREVLHWLAEGKRNLEIAQILGNSQATVKSQVESILRKLQVETRGAAAAVWREAMG